MTRATDVRRRTPGGIILLCLLLVFYSILWIVTWIVAGAVGNVAIAALSMMVAVSVLLLAYFLYVGSPAAWWIALVFLGGSTLWRLSLVAGGEPDNLLNAIVGILLVVYLVSQHDFYRTRRS